MHKVRLLLLSLVVFTSVLYASDKENAKLNQSSFLDNFIFPTSSTKPTHRSEPTKEDVPSKEVLAKRRVSMPILSQPMPSAPKPQDVSSESDLLSKKEAQEKMQKLRLDLLEGQSDLQRQVSGIEKNLTQKLEEVIGSLGNAVVEVKEVPHNLQPDVDGLKSQLEECLKRVATYKEQLQSAASQEAVQKIKSDLEATIDEISETVAQLPTLEEVRGEMTEAAEGFVIASKEYTDKYFVTKKEIDEILVHNIKAHKAVLSDTQANIDEKIPTQSNPQGFAREAHVKGRMDVLAKKMSTKGHLQKVKETIPTVENPRGLSTQVGVDEAVKGLRVAIEAKADRSDLDRYAKKDDITNCVSQKAYEELVTQHAQLQTQIVALQKNNPKELLKSFAKQGALGCVAYQLSPHMASLLRSLKLENSYVDLETVAVPLTTGTISLLARLAQEMYDNPQNVSLKEVVIESVLDGGASAGVMGLKYMFFDDEMNEWFDQLPKQSQTARYGGSYAGLRLLIALFKSSIY